MDLILFMADRIELKEDTLRDLIVENLVPNRMIKQIINDNKIVTALLRYHFHCGVMKKAYESNFEIMPESKEFSVERIDEERKKREQIRGNDQICYR